MFRKKRDSVINVVKTKALISFAVTKKPVFLRRASYCFEGEILVLIVSVPGHCLYFSNVFDKYDLQSIDSSRMAKLRTKYIIFSTSPVKKAVFIRNV